MHDEGCRAIVCYGEQRFAIEVYVARTTAEKSPPPPQSPGGVGGRSRSIPYGSSGSEVAFLRVSVTVALSPRMLTGTSHSSTVSGRT